MPQECEFDILVMTSTTLLPQLPHISSSSSPVPPGRRTSRMRHAATTVSRDVSDGRLGRGRVDRAAARPPPAPSGRIAAAPVPRAERAGGACATLHRDDTCTHVLKFRRDLT